MAPIKKITMRSIGLEQEPDQSAVVIGKYQRARDAYGDTGDYVRFMGHFEAVNEQTGEVFIAPEIILPQIAELAVSGSLQAVQERNRLGSVELAMRLTTVANPEAILGYVWKFDYISEPTGITNPLARLRAKLLKDGTLTGKAAVLATVAGTDSADQKAKVGDKK